MSYPWTGRDSFVADWSKQGDGEDSSQQGLAALLGLVPARPRFSRPPPRRGSPCPCRLAGVTGLWHLWCRAGAWGAVGEPGCCGGAVGSGCLALALLRHGCRRGPTPGQGTPQVLLASVAGTRAVQPLLPACAQALAASHGLVPAGEPSCREVSPHPLTFG